MLIRDFGKANPEPHSQTYTPPVSGKPLHGSGMGLRRAVLGSGYASEGEPPSERRAAGSRIAAYRTENKRIVKHSQTWGGARGPPGGVAFGTALPSQNTCMDRRKGVFLPLLYVYVNRVVIGVRLFAPVGRP